MTPDLIVRRCEEILVSGEKPSVPTVKPIVVAYRRIIGSTNLHAIVDDGNVEDKFIGSFILTSRADGDDAGEALGRVIMRMSKTQRRRL